MKNNVKSLIAMMVIVFAVVSCNAKTEKAEGGDSTAVPVDTTKIDSTQVVKVDTVKQDTTAAQ